MKKLILIAGFIGLAAAVGLQAFYALVPPPEATLERRLAEIVADDLPGWRSEDYDMAESPEAAARISNFLNFDDSLFRVFSRGGVQVGVYIAYWTPGKTSYRWAGAHTPDTCWVQAGWTRLDRRHEVPLQAGQTALKPAEFGTYEKDGHARDVYFWHLVGGEPYGYSQQGMHNIWAALLDVKRFGLNLRKEQFFIRLSSNRPLEELEQMPGFERILAALAEIGLSPGGRASGA
jgi:hypothetical protein